MSERFLNTIRRNAAQMDANSSHGQYGVVASYDPATATAKVYLQPENILSDSFPINFATVGSGIGLIHPPVIGQQVFVLFEGGEYGNGVIVGGSYSDQSPIPNGPTGQPIQSGEFCAVMGKAGAQSYIYMKSDGSLVLQAGMNSITISMSGIVIVGPITQTMGGITSDSDIIGAGKSLDHHTHGGVQTGSGNTGQPN